MSDEAVAMPPPHALSAITTYEVEVAMILGVLCLLLSCYGWWYYAYVMSDTKTCLGAVVFGIGGLQLCLMALIRRIKQRHQEEEP